MRLVFLASLASLFFAVASQAEVQSAQCESVMGTGRQIQLYFMGGALKQVRVVAGPRTVPLIPVALQQQSDPAVTVYSIIGSAELLEMENSVQADGIGYVRFNSEQFSCF